MIQIFIAIMNVFALLLNDLLKAGDWKLAFSSAHYTPGYPWGYTILKRVLSNTSALTSNRYFPKSTRIRPSENVSQLNPDQPFRLCSLVPFLRGTHTPKGCFCLPTANLFRSTVTTKTTPDTQRCRARNINLKPTLHFIHAKHTTRNPSLTR